MGSITDKLSYLKNKTQEIKSAIEEVGVSVPDGATFRQYVELFDQHSTALSGNLQEKTVVPTDTDIEVTADAGYVGLSKVIIPEEPNLQPWNIPKGMTLFGIEGTFEIPVSTDFPSNLPATEEEFDEEVLKEDTNAPLEDKMVLVDNEGNITTGYLYNKENSGLMNYNGTLLPPLPEWDKAKYPYAYLTDRGDVSSGIRYYLWCTETPCVYSTVNGELTLGSDGGDDGRISTAMYYFHNDTWSGKNGGTIAPSAGMGQYGTVIWANTDILNEDGKVYLAASNPTKYTGFEITWYDPATTNFKAVGWRRVSKHTTGELAGHITTDNFTTTESGGWNYLKNIRMCTREKLYYKGVEVWPNMSQTWSYNGTVLPALPAWDSKTYPYAAIGKIVGGSTMLRVTQQPSYRSDFVLSPCPLEQWKLTDGVWAYLGKANSSIEGENALAWLSAKWANHDILNNDGTVYLSASTPIPV